MIPALGSRAGLCDAQVDAGLDAGLDLLPAWRYNCKFLADGSSSDNDHILMAKSVSLEGRTRRLSTDLGERHRISLS